MVYSDGCYRAVIFDSSPVRICGLCSRVCALMFVRNCKTDALVGEYEFSSAADAVSYLNLMFPDMKKCEDGE